MQKDLTKCDNIVYKKMSPGMYSKEVKAVKINNEIIILKTPRFYGSYLHEKKIYTRLKDEDFLPKLKYYDDKHYILGLTDVGDTIEIYKEKEKEKYNKLVENINKQIKNIMDKLSDKYSLYHNDLREKNICIDNHNKIRFIDFECTSEKLSSGEKKYYLNYGCSETYFICSKI
tara:strand:+ start:210 stop:728 length:519 start_codon:yes stop_codon:yes gene_type:complete